jgi:hypothetical protein
VLLPVARIGNATGAIADAVRGRLRQLVKEEVAIVAEPRA